MAAVSGKVGNRIFALQDDSVKTFLTNSLKENENTTTALGVAQKAIVTTHAKIKNQQEDLKAQIEKSLGELDENPIPNTHVQATPAEGIDEEMRSFTLPSTQAQSVSSNSELLASFEKANNENLVEGANFQSFYLNKFILDLRKRALDNPLHKTKCDALENKVKDLMRINAWVHLVELPRPLTQEQSKLIENPTHFGSAYQKNQKILNQVVKNYPAIADTFPDNSAQMNLARTTEKIGNTAKELDDEREAAVTTMTTKGNTLQIKLRANETRLEKSIAAINAEITEKETAIKDSKTPADQIAELTKKKEALEKLIDVPKKDFELVKAAIPKLEDALKDADVCKNPITCKPLLAKCNKEIADANKLAAKTTQPLKSKEMTAAYDVLNLAEQDNYFANLAASVNDSAKPAFEALVQSTEALKNKLKELQALSSKMVTPELNKHYADEFRKKLDEANVLCQDIATLTESNKNTLTATIGALDGEKKQIVAQYFAALQVINANIISNGFPPKEKTQKIINPAEKSILAFLSGGTVAPDSTCSIYHYVQNPATHEYERKPFELKDAKGDLIKGADGKPAKPTLAALEKTVSEMNIDRKANGLKPLELKISNKESDGTFRWDLNCGSIDVKDKFHAKLGVNVDNEIKATAAKTATNQAAVQTQNAPQAADQANQPTSTATFPGAGQKLGGLSTAQTANQLAVVPAVANGVPNPEKLAAAAEARTASATNSAPRSN